ncbi:hypothetical protein DL768_003284 [Monosporascus sp. mg162]|nr:hypothetical protein DL768_003284 [Monosporascus sp. mg162]
MVTATEPHADTNISRLDQHSRSDGYTSTQVAVGERLLHFICSATLRLQQYGRPSTSPRLVSTLEVLFWVYVACASPVIISQHQNIFEKQELSVSRAMPAWILPAYPFLVLGPSARVLDYSQTRSSGLSNFICSLIFERLGWSVAFIMYTVYFSRLARSRLPEESKRHGMFVAVRPAGYRSATLAALGMVAPRVIYPDFLSIHSDVRTGNLRKAFAIPVAMFILLLGFWSFALAVCACLCDARRMKFGLDWWVFVFPTAGFTTGAV